MKHIMERFTLKQLTHLWKSGVAAKLTDPAQRHCFSSGDYDRIGYSCGNMGMNGLLLYDREYKQLLVILGRCSTLDAFF